MGNPLDQAVCAYALASANFPKPSEFSITVSGNNPSPSEFQGSTTPVDVTIGAGDYQVSENGLNVDYFPILIEMRASSATNELSFTGTVYKTLSRSQEPMHPFLAVELKHAT